MARQRVEERAQPVSISFTPSVLRRLEDHADSVGLSRSQLVMEAVCAHLPDHDVVMRSEFNGTAFADGIIVGLDLIRFRWRQATEAGKEKPTYPRHLQWDEESGKRWVRPENPLWRSGIPEDVLEWIDAFLPNLESMYSMMDEQEFWNYIESARRKLRLLVNPNATF